MLCCKHKSIAAQTSDRMSPIPWLILSESTNNAFQYAAGGRPSPIFVYLVEFRGICGTRNFPNISLTQASPEASPEASPKASPKASQKLPQRLSQRLPRSFPKGFPKGFPEAFPKASPKASPKVSAKAFPEASRPDEISVGTELTLAHFLRV